MKILMKITFLAIAAVFFWQCSTDKTEQLSSEMTTELSRMPLQDEMALGFANLAELRESSMFAEIRDSIFTKMDRENEFRDFLTETQFDVRKDVDNVYVSIMPQVHKEPKMLVVAVGNFNAERLSEFIREKDSEDRLTETTVGNHKLFLMAERQKALCFADANHVVFGNEDLVKEWLNLAKNPDPARKDAIANRLANVKYKSGMWMTANAQSMIDEMMDNMPENLPEERLRTLFSVDQVAFSAAIDQSMSIDGVGFFKNNQDAELVRDLAKGALAGFKLSLDGNREAIDVINKIDITTENGSVRMNANFTQNDIQTLAKQRQRYALH